MLWDTGPHVQTISHPHLEVLPGEQVRPEPARVQGNLLVASLRWLAGDRGLPQLAALYRAMPEREQWSLGHVRVDQWYPLRSWETFLQVGDEVLGRGDLALAGARGRAAARSRAAEPVYVAGPRTSALAQPDLLGRKLDHDLRVAQGRERAAGRSCDRACIR